MTGTGTSQRKALLVASDRYEHPELNPLSTPSHDVAALERVLSDELIGDFQVQLSVNEPAQKVREAIEDLFADRRPGDVLLLFFSCHGITDLNGQLYFAMTNTRPDRLMSTAISDRYVRDALDATRSKQNVLLLDCCFSGAFSSDLGTKSIDTMNPAKPFASSKGTVIITASDSAQFAFEGQRGPEPHMSVFSKCLVQGLRTGDADLDRDGEIGVDELYEYLFEKVVEEVPHQKPGISSRQMHGKLVVAKSVRRKGDLPSQLMAAVGSSLPGLKLGAIRELSSLLDGTDPSVTGAAWRELSRLEQDENRTVAQSAARALREVDPGTSQPLPAVKAIKPPYLVETMPAYSVVPESVGSATLRLARKAEPQSRSSHRVVESQRNPVVIAALAFSVVLVLLIWAVSRGGEVGGIDEPIIDSGEVAPKGPVLEDSIAAFMEFSAAVASGGCATPPKRTFIESTRELSCDFPEGTASFAIWPGPAELGRAFEFLKDNNEGVRETNWVVDGEVKGRALEYISKEGQWTAFWADDNLKSGKASFDEAGDDPSKARDWWKTLQEPGADDSGVAP
ncbi:MAG: caspase family protein [Actinomycetota bacterium]